MHQAAPTGACLGWVITDENFEVFDEDRSRATLNYVLVSVSWYFVSWLPGGVLPRQWQSFQNPPPAQGKFLGAIILSREGQPGNSPAFQRRVAGETE